MNNKFLFAVALLMMTVACSSMPKRQSLVVNPERSNVGWEPTNLAFEQQLTEEMLPEVKKNFPPAEDLVLQELVSSIGNKLLSADVYNDPPAYRWNFTVFASPKAKSFSLPAGEIFISTGLIAQTESEAELAGVLAHEVSHALYKHTTRRVQELRRVNKNWKMVGGGLIGASMGYGMGKVNEDPSNGAQRWAILDATQEQNEEVDSIALALAIKAGYDSQHVGRYFLRNLTSKDGDPLPGQLARVEVMKKFCTGPEVRSMKGLVSSNGYAKARAAAIKQSKSPSRPSKKG